MKILKEDIPLYDITAHSLRGHNFYKGIVEYRKKILNSQEKRIQDPDKFKCVLCDKTDCGILFLEWERGYQLYQCQACGAVSANISFKNSHEHIEAVYGQEDYNQKVRREIHEQYEYRKKQFGADRYKYIIDRLKLNKNNIKLLDVGCGPGYFLSYLKDCNIDSKGLEVTQYLADYCQERGLDVSSSDLSHEEDNSYDVIVLFDVLEHLSDPISTFSVIRRKLKRGGYCVAFTPNIHSVGYELMGPKQNTLLPFEHFCFYNDQSIKYLADNTGFSIHTLETFGLDIMDYLLMKEYENNVPYTDDLHDMMVLLQGILDKNSISNHFRITLKVG